MFFPLHLINNSVFIYRKWGKKKMENKQIIREKIPKRKVHAIFKIQCDNPSSRMYVRVCEYFGLFILYFSIFRFTADTTDSVIAWTHSFIPSHTLTFSLPHTRFIRHFISVWATIKVTTKSENRRQRKHRTCIIYVYTYSVPRTRFSHNTRVSLCPFHWIPLHWKQVILKWVSYGTFFQHFHEYVQTN